MSKIKVNEIEKASGSGITVPTGTSFTITDGLAIGSLPTVTVAKGGTNLTSFTAGDLLYATGSTTLAKLPKGTANQQLRMNSGATAPEWATVSSGGLLKTDFSSFSTQITHTDSWVDTDYHTIMTMWKYDNTNTNAKAIHVEGRKYDQTNGYTQYNGRNSHMLIMEVGV